MARHCSTKIFSRQKPNLLLERYFHERGCLMDVDLRAMKETKIDPLFKKWLSLPEDKRSPMDAELHGIFKMSCEKGVKTIIDEAEVSKEILDGKLGGDFDKADRIEVQAKLSDAEKRPRR